MNNPTAAMQPDKAGKKLGPIWLTPGIGYGNAAAGIYASFTTIGLLIYLGFVQPYLLTEVLNIPQGEQGSITGLRLSPDRFSSDLSDCFSRKRRRSQDRVTTGRNRPEGDV